jgi:hypothetical protein
VSALPRVSGGFRFLFITIDTFTKWMETMSVVNNSHEAIVKLLQSFIYMFGIPKWVLTDNETQFKGAKFPRCYSDFGISHQASPVAHPQTNGQECSTIWRQKGRIGIRSFPQYYGHPIPISTEQRGILHSTCFTEHMQCWHQKYFLNQPRRHCLMKKIRLK